MKRLFSFLLSLGFLASATQAFAAEEGLIFGHFATIVRVRDPQTLPDSWCVVCAINARNYNQIERRADNKVYGLPGGRLRHTIHECKERAAHAGVV